MQTQNITRLAKPDIYETRAERTSVLRCQSRRLTLAQTKQKIYRFVQTKNITRLAKPDIYETRAKRTCAMRRQSRWNTLTQIEQENLPTCANQKYDMTCEAWYLWDSRGAHLRYEMPIKMEFAHTNKTWITTDLREPKIFSCFCLKTLNIYFNAFFALRIWSFSNGS